MKENEKRSLVKELYEKYPYPSRETITKEGAVYFAEWVAKIIKENKFFWKGKKLLELGCGTGELACGLALLGANVIGIDFSENSIKKAKENAKKLDCTEKTHFIIKDILEIKENELGEFDAVIALGSLHHTINAKKGFEIAIEHTKENGIVIIGLYNKYSRAKLRAKRALIKFFAGNNIEKRIKFGKRIFGSTGNDVRDADKYGQVHETYHSISEVLGWFKEKKIKFISSKPGFNKPVIDEVIWLLEGKEAFFVMAGKKEERKV